MVSLLITQAKNISNENMYAFMTGQYDRKIYIMETNYSS